jgi:D-alanyl-D-alanine dipeptidase
MKLLAAVLVAGCRSASEPPPEPVASPTVPTFADAAPRASPVLPPNTRQLVTAIVDDWNATRATLRLWRREYGAWHADGSAWPGVVGRAGTAWGDGLHGAGAPSGRTGPIKREGDGKAPAGAFTLARSFGYAPQPPAGTRLPYVPLEPAWKCVDDPRSQHYAEILDERRVTVDWKSAEEMRRKDELYSWVVDIGHNVSRVPNGGSCIFFHVWSKAAEDSVTAGCTAMAEPRLAQLLAGLEPTAIYVLLPRAEYAALAADWDLPR